MFFGGACTISGCPSPHANAAGGGVTIGTPKRRVAARERNESGPFIGGNPALLGATVREAKPAAATCIQVTVLFRRFRKSENSKN
jgi:hypothetical protein